MGLPKITQPLYSLTLPSSGKEILYRPFTVREEKILLIAQEAKDIEQSILSVKQVVNNCLQDQDIDTMSMFDLEYILLLIRAKSVNNNVTFAIKDPDTSEEVKLELNIDDVIVNRNPDHTTQIRVDDDYVIIMRYPTINEYLLLMKDMNNPQTEFQIMISCMDKLIKGDEVLNFRDFSETEINDFADDLSSPAVKEIKNFFSTMPILRHEVHYTNSAKTEKTFVIEGLKTFFS